MLRAPHKRRNRGRARASLAASAAGSTAERQPLELSLTQGIAEPVANRPLDLARVRVKRRRSSDGAGCRSEDATARADRPRLPRWHNPRPTSPSPSILFGRGLPARKDHADPPREQETGSNHARLRADRGDRLIEFRVGIGTPTARSAAQWAPAPIASTRMLGWG